MELGQKGYGRQVGDVSHSIPAAHTDRSASVRLSPQMERQLFVSGSGGRQLFGWEVCWDDD